MKFRKNTFLLATIFIVTQINNSFPQEFLSVDKAIKTALENNYSINIAKSNKEISENNLSLGNAGFYPSLDADASYSKTTSDTKQKYFDNRLVDRNNAKSTNYNAGIDLNWTIFDGFRMFASYDRFKELKKNGEINFKAAVENNISQIISTYYDIVREQQVLEVLNQSIKISEERLRIAEDKRELGSGSKFDMLQAQVDLNEDKSSLLNEELKLKQAKILLNQLMGKEVAADFTVADTILISKNFIYEDLKNLTKENNSDLIIAEQNKNISEADLRLARSDWYPQINLNAGYDFSKLTSETGLIESNRNSGYFYGVNASINLFNGLSTKINIENAEISLKISELQFQQINNSVDAELTNTFENYKISLRLVELETENYSVAQENVEIGLERLKLGNTTPLEFRETQRQLINAKSRLVAAQFEAKNSETELLRISGQLIKNY